MRTHYTPGQILGLIFADIIAVSYLPFTPFWKIGLSLACLFLISMGVVALPQYRIVIQQVKQHNGWQIITVLALLALLLIITLDWQNTVFSWLINLAMSLFIIWGGILALIHGVDVHKPNAH
ncbi:hypothetical protein J5F27_05960 [Schleiferilactobacillus harbinensis]|jgi:uncharacterized membrane protein HdeD (DUF308 family)|uniref:Uncharacterized protein n=1 Tax=Schleiferilactobacillus harbinensis TaxID=304207 RepID=A0A510TWG4_9LACO|nr:hypothetical protein [Schleiferilactobacillus harbinensis]MBO3091465.1 hypothetical protein [Schleiferilactobacillus harbinensis]QFR22261.1 hypothetical protein D1010_01710 [Schleiferilactobacillus harbinensis]GEK06623.1 hypothetical protein LHA01_18620 [Schleiferilactobacillus harbinensis]